MSKPKDESTLRLPDEVIRQLLTPSEIRMIKNRWQILQLLEQGLTIRSIAEKISVGTDTVVRVAKMVEKAFLRKKIFSKSKTSWIFGKSD